MRRLHTSRRTRRAGRALWILVVLAAAVGLFALRDRLPGLGGDDEPVLQGATVRRGPLRINVIERGNLKAANNVELVSELEGTTTILYLIDEGSRVEKGELVAELDATALVEKRVTQEIAVQNAEGAWIKAKQNLEIQRSQNVSDVATAERQLDFARRDQKKYLEGDFPQLLQAAEDAILLANEDLKRAEDQLKWSRDLQERGFLTRTELEADELAHKRAEIKVEQVLRDKALLVDYDFPRESRRLEADIEEAERELARVRLQAEARLVDYEADVRTSKARLDLENEKLARYQAQIDKAKIRAPQAGMVVYAQERGGRWGGDEPIAPGTQVRERQAIVTIPATDGMIAQASLHESVLEQVEVGQRVIVRIDALPDREFNGRVRFKAVLPDQNSWFANPNLRVYRCDVEILDNDPRMRPGMSCSLEIVVADIPDALHVPVQSVFLDAGRTIAFVAAPGGPQPREVEIGRHNPSWVEIRSGLAEGEVVLLSPPTGYRLEAALEEEEPTPAGEAITPPANGIVPPAPGMGGPAADRPRGAPDGAPRRPDGERSRERGDAPNGGAGAARERGAPSLQGAAAERAPEPQQAAPAASEG